ncbi:uncharacterized protein LOC142357501, partial [Convolutriloba macropyga]|uniref:uncharacterized protein LOC142357501 n=1 Tax=Convolutriloba macropyga TaxID=536237 RepID=UPI003F51C8F8
MPKKFLTLLKAPPVPSATLSSPLFTEILLVLQTESSLFDLVQLEIRGENEDPKPDQDFTSPFSSLAFFDLTPNTQYKVKVTLLIDRTARNCVDGSVSSSRTFFQNTLRPTTPSNLRFSFVTSSVCRVRWTANPYFISDSQLDSYNVLLNGELVTKVAANKQEFSANLGNLDLCSSYNVSIQPTSGSIIYDSLSVEIRSWKDSAMIAQTYTNFPQALDECDICPSVDLTDICSFPFTSRGVIYSKCGQRSDGSRDLFCHNSLGQEIGCNKKADFC